MPRTRSLTTTTAVAAALSLSAAAPALAQTSAVGSANGTPDANVCSAQFTCTYLNLRDGKPVDVVKRAGTVTRWKVAASSTGGQVRLRVLRRTSRGRLRFVRSSGLRTVSALGVNTFATRLKVRKGDVLALTNASSGIYMASAPSRRTVAYFDYTADQADGAEAKPNRTAPALRVLLSGVIDG